MEFYDQNGVCIAKVGKKNSVDKKKSVLLKESDVIYDAKAEVGTGLCWFNFLLIKK